MGEFVSKRKRGGAGVDGVSTRGGGKAEARRMDEQDIEN